jgi:hypothetical protein
LFRVPNGIIEERRGDQAHFTQELHMMQMPKIAARQAWWGGVLCLVGLLAAATPAAAIQLVTEQEAALPPDRLPGLELRGSPTRRPSAVIVSPPPNAGLMKSPVSFRIKLQAHGGAKIDPDSIVVTYKKTPEIDITQRIMPFITADGIDVPDAEVPPGTHAFRIELKDNEGHLGATDFSFQVGK